MSKTKTGLMNIKPGKISYTILKWMQDHNDANSLHNTTCHAIVEKICESDDVTSGNLTVEQTFSKMVKCNVIYKDRHEKSVLADYRINYWHKSIPADILANAPAEVKRAMAKTIDNMQPNQYMDDEGCVVTPNAVEKTEDPFSEGTITMGTPAKIHGRTLYGYELDTSGEGIVAAPYVPKEPGTFENPIKSEKDPWEKDSTTVPLKITKSDDGKQITVNLSLVINL